MILLAALRRSGGLDALARRLQLNPPAIVVGVTAFMPVLVRALRAYVANAGGGQLGFDALLALLNEWGDGELAANVMGPEPLRQAAGEALLARLFPEGVEAAIVEAARSGGVERAFLERLASPLAMLVGGYIAAKAVSGDLATPKALLAIDQDDGVADFALRNYEE